MGREKKEWNKKFVDYMEMIVDNPNYQGIPYELKDDGSIKWVAPAKSEIGEKRIKWAKEKATELGIPEGPGMYADVMLALHPTKAKPCQICGKTMSLYYVYPNSNFLKKINDRFHVEFTNCDSIKDILFLLESAKPRRDIINFFATTTGLQLSESESDEEIIKKMEYACRKENKKFMGPGAMSDFPDRLDGFHTYNRCCRGKDDKGRSRENLKTYSKDRRAFEYWSDGNIHAADLFMHSSYFNGSSGDHIGPISLGFVHDPHYIKAMDLSDNINKRDRLLYEDLVKIDEIENRTNICPMTWFSKDIWIYIKNNYKNRPNQIQKYRSMLKINMRNFMFALNNIVEKSGEKGQKFLIDGYLMKNAESFKYDYEFDSEGNITKQKPRHNTGRNSQEVNRYVRKAMESVSDFAKKENRNTGQNLSKKEMNDLEQLNMFICNDGDTEDAKKIFDDLMKEIQGRLLKDL